MVIGDVYHLPDKNARHGGNRCVGDERHAVCMKHDKHCRRERVRRLEQIS